MMRAYKRGFTLVELMVTVAIVGVLASLALVGVRHYLSAAKTSEAKQMVGAISRGAIASYERPSAPAELLAVGKTATVASHALCASATPVPASVPKGKKYQPVTGGSADFNAGSSTAGWPCLRFSESSPILFRYQYRSGAGLAPLVATAPNMGSGTGFEASAQGDLDADGILSTFSQTGVVDSTSQSLSLATELFVDQETE